MPDLAPELDAARSIVEEASRRGDGWLSPHDAQRVLEAMGIPCMRSHCVESEDAAVQQAAAMGYPVALKAAGLGILHKMDVGGVKLNLANESAVRAAYVDLRDKVGNKMSGAMVQRMAAAGLEMFIGGLQDPSFGPVVFCGSGGVLVELFRDAACRLAPLTDVDAADMLNEIRGFARLRGFRGGPASDEGSLREAVLRVGTLLDGCPEIQELDINPIVVFSEGASALDVRIRVGTAPARPRRRPVRY